jgi:hypothetical protein
LLFVLRPAVALAAFLSLTLSAAADCAFRVGPAATPASVSKYLPVLQSCEAADGRRAMSIREMTIGGESVALLADAEALTTRLERLACWTCRDASEDELASTRMGRAIAASAEAPGIAHRGFLQNAGLTRGAKPGAFVTGDLCPSPKPLDRAFFTRLAATGPHTPVALAVSGLWLTYHPKEFRWLADQRDAGALDIVWVDHTYTHPYRRKLPNASNYLLTRGVNPEDEILRTEKLIIADGETPVAVLPLPGPRLERSADAGGAPVSSGHPRRRRVAGDRAEARTRLDRTRAPQRQRALRPQSVLGGRGARRDPEAPRTADGGAGIGLALCGPSMRSRKCAAGVFIP